MEHLDSSGRRRMVAGLIAMLVGAICLVASIPGQAGAQAGGPPGNNGTVKIDGVDFDDHPNNEPHVGCVFQVDFYGYDEGELFADVTFEVWPPTGNEVILEDTDIFIGEDDNGGGGSEAGLDASETYDLTSLLADFEPHPQQGWHVKLTVNADGSQGADVKHKVFWVTGCEAPPTTTTSTSTTSTSTTTTTVKPTSTTTTSTTSTTVKPTSTTTTSTTSTTEKPTSTTTTSTTSTTEKPTSTTTTSTTSTTEKPTSTTEATTTTTEKPTSTTEKATTTTEKPTTTTTEAGSTTSSSTTTTVMASTTTSITRPGGTLPKTGGDSDGLLIVAGLALLLGGAALVGSTKLARRPLT
jgi:LPXTG-motif cell wall-anchored protein